MSAEPSLVTIGIIAGHLIPTPQDINPDIGKQFNIGTDFSLAVHIKPDIARQWIQALEPIASKESN